MQIGGSSGMGKSVVRLLLRRGVKVVFADLDQEKGDMLKAELRANGYASVDFIKASVLDDTSLAGLVQYAHGMYGPIAFAVNTAGITGHMAEVHEVSEDIWRNVIAVDLEGVWRFSKTMVGPPSSFHSA